ncbi:ATP-binding protein [Bacteroidaceae bacterium]
MEKELKIVNDIEELSYLAEFVEEICESLSLSPETTMNINLALEEAVVNVIMYAYPPLEEHNILLKATLTDQQLIFLLTDNGLSFDPTQMEDADITSSIEERPIGGLGIFLIRSIMNEVSYQRLDGQNQLTMKKNIEK